MILTGLRLLHFIFLFVKLVQSYHNFVSDSADHRLLPDVDRDDVQLVALLGRCARVDDRILPLRVEEVRRCRCRRRTLPLTSVSLRLRQNLFLAGTF